MAEHETSETIKLFLDDDPEPFKVAHPPLTFRFNTIALPDGPHRLRIEASNGLAPPTVREIPFVVRNGVALSVSGLEAGQTIGGQVQMVINAYAGSAEIEFEPRRAETPQPIPTWAWVVFLAVVAWATFYVIRPTPRAAETETYGFRAEPAVGVRIYEDTCARCHGEDGTGREPLVPALRDGTIALAPTPARLLAKVTAGVRGHLVMPAWGTRLTNEEIVAVVNYVRSHWGHDGSLILPRHRTPPPGVQDLEARLGQALREKDVEALAQCCWPKGTRPQLFRTDGIEAIGAKPVSDAWRAYFDALGSGSVQRLQLIDARYDYDPATVHNEGSIVIATGRIFLETLSDAGEPDTAKGRFIRTYEHTAGTWTLIFDFADIPMAVGCEPGSVVCPPPEGLPLPPVEPRPAAGVGYAEVQALLAGIGKSAPTAPHENFWTLPYEEFMTFAFPAEWGVPGSIRLVVPGYGEASNLVRALRDGRGIVLDMPDGSVRVEDLARMPKGAPPLSEEQIATIVAWIDAGCPEVGGGPPYGAGPDALVSDRGYEEIQALLRGLERGAASAPHENFWELGYEEFVALRFPLEWGAPGTIRLLVPGDGSGSNLVKALRDGKGIVVEMPDGTVRVVDVARMPKAAPPMRAEDVDAIEAWIDAGAPRVAGVPARAGPPLPGSAPNGEAPPSPGAVEGFPPPQEAPAPGGFPPPREGPAPGGVPPPREAPAPGGFPPPREAPAPGAFPPPREAEGGALDAPADPLAPAPAPRPLGYAGVQALLREVGRRTTASDAPHGAFWDLPHGAFLVYRFPVEPGSATTIRLLVPGDAEASNLVRALRDGRGIVVDLPDGSRQIVDLPRMPRDGPPMAAEDVARIAAWIDAGAPQEAPR